MLYRAVFFSSCAAIGFEILLTRVFSIGQWNHLSFMVISIALFGFAASGTFLGLIDARAPGRIDRLSPWIVVAYAFSSLAGSNDVFAWSDEDGNGELDEGDFFGNHPLPVPVTAGVTTTGVDIEVAPVLSLDEAFATLIDRLGSREAVGALLRTVVGLE